MDPMNGVLLGEADVDPEADEGKIREGEDEEEGREVNFFS